MLARVKAAVKGKLGNNIKKTVIEHYINNDDPAVWIKDVFKCDDEPLYEIVGRYEFPDIELKVDPSGKITYDVENIEIIYTAMKDLPPSFASEEVVWAGLAHGPLRYYAHAKMMRSKNKKSDDLSDLLDETEEEKKAYASRGKVENAILNSFFFPGKGARARIEHSLSRLWWYGKVVYLENEPEDPYRLLHYCSNDINGTLFRMCGSNWTNCQKVVKATLEVFQDYKEKNPYAKGKRELFNAFSGVVNEMSGIYMMDALSEDRLQDMLTTELERLVE